MEEKRFETYINGKKEGTINVSWNSCIKKRKSGSFRGMEDVLSLSGYYLLNNNILDNKHFDKKVSIDDKIQEKQDFVYSVITDLKNNLKDKPLINDLIEKIKVVKNILDYLNPNINENFIFLTEEEIYNKKSEINNNLDECIKIIEEQTEIKPNFTNEKIK